MAEAAKNLIEGTSLNVVYSQRSGNIYQTVDNKAKKTVVVSEEKSNADGKIVPHGKDNLFPQKVLKELRKNSIIGSTLKRQAEIAYDKIVYGINQPNEKGEVEFKRVIDPKVEAFFKRSLINRYVIEAFRNFYFFYFVSPRIILTADRSEVYSIGCYKTAHFRFGVQDSSGFIPYGYVNADWENISDVNDPHVERIPLINPFEDPEYLKGEGKDFKYIYPLAYPTEDEVFYPLADWNSARESGWLDVAQSVAIFKKSLFKNQGSFKYHVKVPSWWWEWKYPGFDQKEASERRKIMDYEIDQFEKMMRGEENAGNSIMTTYVSDPKFNREFQGWEINAIDDKLKDGIYIEDSNEAASHLLYALSMDPVIIGSQPGSKLGAGSGSDKRVAFNIYLDMIKAHQDLILEPLTWIGQYNGWEDYVFMFESSLKPKSNDTGAKQESKDPLNEPNQQAN